MSAVKKKEAVKLPYIVVTGGSEAKAVDMSEFLSDVATKIREGYTPVGGVNADSRYENGDKLFFYQAMMLKEDK